MKKSRIYNWDAPFLTQGGAMYEINFIAWPLIYGLTGYHLGAIYGHPIVGVAVGIFFGIVTAVPMVRSLFYDVEIFAPWLLIPIYIFVSSENRRWYLIALCALPWLRLLLGNIMKLLNKTVK